MKAVHILLSIVFVIAVYAPTDGEPQPDAPRRTQVAGEIAPAAMGAQSPDPDQPNANFWMDQKLRLSKELLTGLALADFDLLGKNAEVLRGLNRVEAFVRREPEGYRDELKQFNMATKALVRAAKEENLEAATLAFNRLTISCVSCHQELRESE